MGRCVVCGSRASVSLCGPHATQWVNSGEWVRAGFAESSKTVFASVVFANFVRRIQAEERNGRHE